MFASISRFRRHVAVLAALALMASMLAAVPIAADEHPEMDYTATFDACVGVPASGFEDVPANHANAGDIDCIAYYGITMGTSDTTYSPLMSVTREHMALFLSRLAGRVGIEMALILRMRASPTSVICPTRRRLPSISWRCWGSPRALRTPPSRLVIR